MKQIIINKEELQTRVAVVNNGVLQDFFMERSNRDRMVGSIYKAKIKNLEPSLQAAFVDIGCGKNAFLHYWDMIPASQEILEEEAFRGNAEEPLEEISPVQTKNQQKTSPHSPRPQQDQKSSSNTQNSSSQGRNRGRRSYKKNQDHQQDKTAGKPQENQGFFARLTRKLFPFLNEEQADQNSRNSSGGDSRNGNAKGTSKKKKGTALPPGLVPLVPSAQQPQQPGSRHPKKKNPPKIVPTIDEIPDLFKVDQEILVQVTKGPIGTKGARVTTNLSIPGRYLVLLPNSTHIGVSRRVEERSERDRLRQMMRGFKLPHNMGLICRTVGVGVKQEHFQRDLDLLLEYWNKGKEIFNTRKAPCCVYQEPTLAERTIRDCLTEDVDEIITDSQEIFSLATDLLKRYNCQEQVTLTLYQNPTPIFNKYNLVSQIENISNRKVYLPGGGYICIDETEALIAIDVNTGKNRSGKDQPETILSTNMEAVAEIARQLRLRNIGGIVVLDLIDMRSKKDQQAVYKSLKDHLSEDRARIKTYPITSLGLVEMTRQREDESLESTIYDECPYCKGRGLVKSTTTMSAEIQRELNTILGKHKNIQQLKILVHPQILERLRKDDRKLIDAMAKEFTCELTFRSDPDMHIEEFKIRDPATNKEL